MRNQGPAPFETYGSHRAEASHQRAAARARGFRRLGRASRPAGPARGIRDRVHRRPLAHQLGGRHARLWEPSRRVRREGTVRQGRRWPRCSARRALEACFHAFIASVGAGRGSPSRDAYADDPLGSLAAASEGATRRLAPHASPRAGNNSATGRRTDAREPGRAPARLGARRQHRTAGPDEAGRAATAPRDSR